jgi:hypothetical protein
MSSRAATGADGVPSHDHARQSGHPGNGEGASVKDSGLFLLSGAQRNDPVVDAWFAAHPGATGELARSWFDQLLRCGGDVCQLLHDGCPVACVNDAALGYVNVFTRHASLGFFNGADLDDPSGLLQGTGKRMRHIKLLPDAPPDARAVHRLIEDACADLRNRLADARQ